MINRQRKFILLLLGIILFACCSYKGIILSGIHDGERMEEGDSVPFALQQNYPNPFNPSTIICFSVGTEMFLTLAVYTEDWERVLIVVQDLFELGHYSVTAMLQDSPSGEYFYTLSGGGYTLIRKMRLTS